VWHAEARKQAFSKTLAHHGRVLIQIAEHQRFQTEKTLAGLKFAEVKSDAGLDGLAALAAAGTDTGTRKNGIHPLEFTRVISVLHEPVMDGLPVVRRHPEIDSMKDGSVEEIGNCLSLERRTRSREKQDQGGDSHEEQGLHQHLPQEAGSV